MVEFFKELFSFLKTRKKFWLLPLIIVVAALAALIIATQSSPVAPFIYTIF